MTENRHDERNALQELCDSLIPGAALSAWTTFQLGGPCLALACSSCAEQLCAAVRVCYEQEWSALVIGQGSNLLVADHGVDAVVLRYVREQADITLEQDRLRVSGGTLLRDLVRDSIELGVESFIYCTGIPGTVGGALAGNAGAFGRQIGENLESVTLLDLQGNVKTVGPDYCCFGYRDSTIKVTGEIVLDAVFRIERMQLEPLQAEYERIMQLRRDKHPDWKTTPCAGSFFKNVKPTSAAGRRQSAGWFLDQVGAKSMTCGGAGVFPKHANILVRKAPDCTARDVLVLSQQLQVMVQERFGIDLEREVRLVGQW